VMMGLQQLAQLAHAVLHAVEAGVPEHGLGGCGCVYRCSKER
jgi:hypothetical protein